MTPHDFFVAHDPLAVSVGRSYAPRMKFRGFDTSDAIQSARVILWQLSQRADLRSMDNAKGYVYVSLGRAMNRVLTKAKVLFPSGAGTTGPLARRVYDPPVDMVELCETLLEEPLCVT